MEAMNKERNAFLRNSFRGLYMRNLGANLLGFMIIATLNVVTPLEFFRSFRAFLFQEGYWKVFFLFFPLLFCLLVLVQRRVQSPIERAAGLKLVGESVPDNLEKKAQQRLLNLPFAIVGMNLVSWIILPALVASSFYLFMEASLRICLFLYFRTFMIALIASGLSFFLVEGFSRKTFIPLFFPKGRLAAVPHTIKK